MPYKFGVGIVNNSNIFIKQIILMLRKCVYSRGGLIYESEKHYFIKQ